jgi:hypothetical protein
MACPPSASKTSCGWCPTGKGGIVGPGTARGGRRSFRAYPVGSGPRGRDSNFTSIQKVIRLGSRRKRRNRRPGRRTLRTSFFPSIPCRFRPTRPVLQLHRQSKMSGGWGPAGKGGIVGPGPARGERRSFRAYPVGSGPRGRYSNFTDNQKCRAVGAPPEKAEPSARAPHAENVVLSGHTLSIPSHAAGTPTVCSPRSLHDPFPCRGSGLAGTGAP